MAAENWNACFSHVLGSEGAYQADPNDKGNWTGCEVGKGQNKGTNWGISACSYPDEDIKNLTKDDAKRIYKEDYWDETECDLLPYGVDLCTFDSSVNSGCGQGAIWLQRAVGVTADGDVGQQTVEAANACEPHAVIDKMCNDRLDFLKDLSTWDRYGKGWTSRVETVRKDAHAMQNANPGPVLEPEDKPVKERKTVLTVLLRISAHGPVHIEVADDVQRE